MENWVLLRKGADFQHISEKFHISPRVASLIRNRDVIGDDAIEKYLNGTIADLYDGMLMKDMDKAVAVLGEKIKENVKIRIIGDYDIDGIQSTYILLEGFRMLGADVDSDIPDRMKDGYGLNRNLIDRALEADVDTIITCDNGIAAAEEIAYAKSMGMTVVVTDHHEVPYTEIGGERRYILPEADAVVDPKQEDCTYPFKGLCGAAVAYKLVEALMEAMGKDAEDADYLMENVAIATIGDVMDLVDENRIFVKQGLDMLKRTENLGLKALMECTGVNVDKLSSYHIGFVIGPCMNASGRLDTAKRALELLEAKKVAEADLLAGDLKALNDSRKDMTAQAVEEAFIQVENSELKDADVLVVYLPECHESLAGIVAGKVRERFYRPAFVLTDGKEEVKGSGRSIDEYSMYDEMVKCSRYLDKFGGHPMAAGLSLKKENIESFRKAMNENCRLEDNDLIEKVKIDIVMPVDYATKEIVHDIEKLEPCGKGNEKPVFAARSTRITGIRVIGKTRCGVKLTLLQDDGLVMDGIFFTDPDVFIEDMERRFGTIEKDCLLAGNAEHTRLNLLYEPRINEWQGRETLQINIRDYC